MVGGFVHTQPKRLIGKRIIKRSMFYLWRNIRYRIKVIIKQGSFD